ncbi:hypothetical protein CA11_25530 [Gimesia maris]|uniref:pre-toxin TG domain-containing protein n=1 Tax=Gimesia maris TaxID=122 RepID=UPI00118D04BF|nr:pre-toxin TG domain-containing protein [Gimesia maris]QDU14743.1 hypothetical protein CA11_25530 [Gimesia maris]
MSKRMLMILAVFVSGWLPALSYADEKVDFYFRFLASYARSPDSIEKNVPAGAESFFRRHGVKNIHELRLGFNRAQLAELAQKLAEEYQRVLKNPRSMVRTNALELLHEFVRDLDPQLAARLPRPQRRQSSGVGPQNAIEDSIKVNHQTMGLGQAAINQGYILGESQGQLRMPKVTRPRNPTPGSFADRFRNRMPDQLGNDLGKQTGQLLDLDSLPQLPALDLASRPATIRNPEPREGFEFNEGGFLTPDANFEPDPPGSETEMAQADQSTNPNDMQTTESNQIKGKYDDPELNQIYEDFQELKNSKASNEEQHAAQPETPMKEFPDIPYQQQNDPEPDLESDLLVERPEFVKPPLETATASSIIKKGFEEVAKTLTKTDIPINAYEAYSGYDLITGEPLSPMERVGRGAEVAVDLASRGYGGAAVGALVGSAGGPITLAAGAVVGAVAGEVIIKGGKKVYKWLNP